MTGATGHGAGVVGCLDFYLDDIPNRIDQPIFPQRTWHSARNLTQGV